MLRHKTEEHHNRNVPVNVVCSVRTRSFLNSVSDFRVSTGARFVASDVLCEKFPACLDLAVCSASLDFFQKKDYEFWEEKQQLWRRSESLSLEPRFRESRCDQANSGSISALLSIPSYQQFLPNIYLSRCNSS